MFKKVTIIGVGLIGGSLGLAIKKRKLAREVIGVVRRKSSLRKAKKFKAVSWATMNLEEGVKDADLVILATSVEKIIRLGKEASKFMKPGAILMDVGSVKEKIINVLGKEKPRNIDFIGAHPMAGSEKSGVAEARADLFEGSICIICPERTAKKESFSKVEKFWNSLGCKIVKIPSLLHDRYIAEISHTPHLVSNILSASVEKGAFKFASTGFCDTTRIALSDPELWSEILLMNRANEIKHLKYFENIVKRAISILLNKDHGSLRDLLKKGRNNRLEIDKCRTN